MSNLQRAKSTPHFAETPSSATLPRSYSQLEHHTDRNTHTRARIQHSIPYPAHLAAPARSPCVEKEDPFALTSGFFPSYPFAEENEDEWRWLHPSEPETQDGTPEQDEPTSIKSLFSPDQSELAERAIINEEKWGALVLSIGNIFTAGEDRPVNSMAYEHLLSPYANVGDEPVDLDSLYLAIKQRRRAKEMPPPVQTSSITYQDLFLANGENNDEGGWAAKLSSFMFPSDVA